MSSNGEFSVGTAHRTAVQTTPVKHILVRGYLHDWEVWCSASRGREGNPYGNRLCRICRDLAREALDQGMLGPSEVGREWFSDEQLARGES